jgi:diguanylate cyclase (GGDEF)-like protein/PAS domain S-box-containing protein
MKNLLHRPIPEKRMPIGRRVMTEPGAVPGAIGGADPEPLRVDELSREELDRICMYNLLTTASEQIYFKDVRSRFLRVSAGLVSLFEVAGPAELEGLSDFDFFSDEHARTAYEDEQRIIATGEPLTDIEELETWPDRPDSWVSTTKLPLRDFEGRIIGTFGISREITRRVLAEREVHRKTEALTDSHAELQRLERELRTVLETSPDSISWFDTDLRYRYANPATELITGQANDTLIGRSNRELEHGEDFLVVWEAALRRVLATGRPGDLEWSSSLRGHPRWYHSRLVAHVDDDGEVIGVLTSTRDLSDLKAAEQALAHQAVHDTVTGLANRALLLDRVAQSLLRLERLPGRIAVLFVDLDFFKTVNDTLGHDAGDQVLVEVARRLESVSRRTDTVARFGGDEFVVLCDKLRLDEDVRVVAERVVRVLAEPVTIDGREVQLSASIGIVVNDDPYARAEELIRDADAAMYQAKERGRGRFQFFDPALRDRAMAKHALEAELRVALDRGEFRLLYQPLFSLVDKSLIGVEALIRWEHPVRGLLAPEDFINVAEERGLITSIGAWVLDEACRQLAEWMSAGGPRVTMAVNVSQREFTQSDFVSQVEQVLGKHGVEPALLCLEVSETALLAETAEIDHVFAKLSALGVRLALDDFGTGYSALTHLRHFSVDMLKIDRSFVERLGSVDRDREIVEAVTAMAHALGMTIVGEGIESSGQLSDLQRMGCDEGQGYLLARPQSAQEMTTLLATESGRWF